MAFPLSASFDPFAFAAARGVPADLSSPPPPSLLPFFVCRLLPFLFRCLLPFCFAVLSPSLSLLPCFCSLIFLPRALCLFRFYVSVSASSAVSCLSPFAVLLCRPLLVVFHRAFQERGNHFKNKTYLCTRKGLGGEMVDTRDLKSLGPKRPCGFDSRPRHWKKRVN